MHCLVRSRSYWFTLFKMAKVIFQLSNSSSSVFNLLRTASTSNGRRVMRCIGSIRNEWRLNPTVKRNGKFEYSKITITSTYHNRQDHIRGFPVFDKTNFSFPSISLAFGPVCLDARSTPHKSGKQKQKTLTSEPSTPSATVPTYIEILFRMLVNAVTQSQ